MLVYRALGGWVDGWGWKIGGLEDSRKDRKGKVNSVEREKFECLRLAIFAAPSIRNSLGPVRLHTGFSSRTDFPQRWKNARNTWIIEYLNFHQYEFPLKHHQQTHHFRNLVRNNRNTSSHQFREQKISNRRRTQIRELR